MAPVPPLPCVIPGCGLSEDGDQFWTDNHCSSYAEAKQAMRDHVEVHKIVEAAKNRELDEAKIAGGFLAPALAPPPLGPGPPPLAPQRSQTEKITRPTISEGTDEIQWDGFLKKFTRYKRVTNVQGQAACDQLWYCMSADLEEAVTQDGAGEDITEVALMAKIKKLAVRKSNILVNQAKFMKLGQERDEDCGAFIARLRGAAQVSSFRTECPHCELEVSYADKMIAHQLVVALEDEVIQAKILTQVANQDPTLHELITMVEAHESGKRSTKALQDGAGSLNRVSAYQKQKHGNKNRGPPEPLGVVKPQTSPPAVQGGPKAPRKCFGCGRDEHGPGNVDRPHSCFAWTIYCKNCGLRGHIAEECWRERKAPEKEKPKAFNTLEETEVTEEEMNTITEYGSFFHMIPVESNRRFLGRLLARDARKGATENKSFVKLKARKRKRKTPKRMERDRKEIAACQERMLSMMEEEEKEEKEYLEIAAIQEKMLEEEETKEQERKEIEKERREEQYWGVIEEEPLYTWEQMLEDGRLEDEERRQKAVKHQQDSIETISSTRLISRIPRWKGLRQKTPRLQESASRSEPGTPGALGGGPVQPPGGPGGTRDRGYQYCFEDPEGDNRRRRH
jgi:hypothetical protein